MPKIVKPPEYLPTTDEFILGIREGYPLKPEEIFIILRYLVVFSLGCKKYKIESGFNQRLDMFILDLHKMGYGQNRISSMVSSVCNFLNLE